jgi:hypothetical protein
LLSAHVAQAGVPPPGGYFSFEAEVMSGDYTGTLGFGEVYYDPGALIGGPVTLDPTSGLIDFFFTILGQTFFISDDAGYPASPIVDFLDFMPTYIDFLVIDDGVDILQPNVISLGIDSAVTPGLGLDALCLAIDNGGCYANYYVEAFVNVAEIPEVPLPAALWLFGSGLLGLIGVSRRKKMN